MAVLENFRHVQRFCKDKGHKISFADVRVANPVRRGRCSGFGV
jgi:hypothetical protein